MPNPDDHHRSAIDGDRIAEDVGPAAERHDELAEPATDRPSPFGKVAERAIGALDLVQKTIGGARVPGGEESPKPLDIPLGAGGEDDVQSLRGSGRGKGLSPARLLSQATNSSNGTASPVRSKSAKARSSSASASGDQGP